MAAIRVQCSRIDARTSSPSQSPPALRPAERLPSRREHLAKLALLPVALPSLCASVSAPALAAEALPSISNSAVTAVAPQAPPPSKLKSFVARDFLVQYPTPQFKVIEEEKVVDAPRGPAKDNPVRVELGEASGNSKVTVLQIQASKLKQSFLQITDISMLGTPAEVVRMVLPPTTKVLSTAVKEFPQPPRNTGTVVGVIERDPVKIYRYEVILPNEDHAEVAVGALLGRVLLLGAAAAEDKWSEEADGLREIAESFKLLPR